MIRKDNAMNQTPIIPCAGPCGDARLAATPHAFVRSDMIRTESGVRVGRAHVFRCQSCGAERRYGLVG